MIEFARPSITRRERRAVQRVLRSGWLTSGRESELLEREFAAQCGVAQAVSVSSASAALHIGLEVLGVNSESVVLLSPYTFNASAAAVLAVGARVCFVDIAPNSFNIDPLALERALTHLAPHQRGAIMPIHIGGMVCNMPEICAIAARHSLAVIEDAAHAQPGFGEGAAVGARGDCTVFSMYATKPIAGGEGGIIVTESEERAARLRLLRDHGIDRIAWRRRGSDSSHPWHYDIVAHGYKYNLPDILAALARVQLRRAAVLRERRRRIAERYRRALADLDWLEVPPTAPHHAWHLFIVTLRPERLSIDRDEVMHRLAVRGVRCSLHYIPLHITTFWRRRLAYRPTDFPHALQRSRYSFSLPLYPAMRGGDVARVVEALRAIGAKYRR